MTSYGSDSYSYNSANQRLKKTESGTTTYYLRAGLDVLAEYDGSGVLEAEYIYGIDGMVTKVDPSAGNLWFVKDHLGSTRRLDSSSMLRDYYPFGEDYTSAGSETDYQFTGKEKDGSELYYFGARYYDSRIGRWMSVDALGDQLPSHSPYHYSFNNPLNAIDPDGNFPFVLPALVPVGKLILTGLGLATAAIAAKIGYDLSKEGVDILGVNSFKTDRNNSVSAGTIQDGFGNVSTVTDATSVSPTTLEKSKNSPTKTDPKTAEEAKQKLRNTPSPKSKQVTGDKNKPPSMKELSKKNRKPTTKEQAKIVINKGLELINAMFGAGKGRFIFPPVGTSDEENEKK